MLLLINRLKQTYPVSIETVKPCPNLAAVMVLLYESRGVPYIILIRRSQKLRRHPGEIGFPGGIFEKTDSHLLATAQRETFEELNLWVEESLLIGRLHKVRTQTGYEITPFIAFTKNKPKCYPNNMEVEEVYDIPLIPLLGTQTSDVRFKNSIDMLIFSYRGNRIWGATAKILSQLSQLKTD